MRNINNLNSSNEIKIRWSRVPSRISDRSYERSFLTPETEKKFLYLLNTLGVMLGGQIQTYQILHHSKKTARKILGMLKKEKKIIEHALIIGGKEYKLYTLGPTGAAVMNIPYQPNYWVWYSDSEAIERLMAVDLYIRMCDYLSANLTVVAAEKPYIHTFIHGDRTYKIGVIWDNIMSFIEIYRWEQPKDRIILICQSLNQISNLGNYLEEQTPVRIITREKLREGLIFYRLINKRWVLDIPDKQIMTKPIQKIIHKPKVLLS